MVAGMSWSQRMAEGMNRSARTVAVLSPAYVASEACAAEWQAAWPSDPVGAQRRLLPVRVAAFAPPAPFDGIVYTDLVGMAADVAAGRLTAAVDAVLTGGARPTVAPAFPGGSESPESSGSESPEGRRPRFPGVAPAVWSVDWPRNRLFTGREVELSLLRERLAGGGTAGDGGGGRVVGTAGQTVRGRGGGGCGGVRPGGGPAGGGPPVPALAADPGQRRRAGRSVRGAVGGGGLRGMCW
ncbi:hypothetical protein FDG2_4607 [Candidatus Protofrankia californiensis]|uniref:TIR domain-containing protein n=1 Tax=Candidatus Protofrankia californiensis TaxID=1839754 RepID=A0A1C3P734_9ACTN|nr:hypothetical protein FDG2_4607 [Candidatus Protofrankia californiensis]